MILKSIFQIFVNPLKVGKNNFIKGVDNMIIKIWDKDNYVSGVYVYENNENGDVFIQDTYHCDAKEGNYDTIFGTNEKEIIIKMPMNETMEERVCCLLEELVNNKFKNLDFVQNDYNKETNILSWSFVDDCETEEKFFDKMRKIKDYINSMEYTAELIKFPRNCHYNYSEARINVNIYGGELQ